MKRLIFTVSIVVFTLAISNTNLHPYISCNGSGSGYGEGAGGGIAALQGSSIEDYIIEGAGYYLKGQSFIQAFLNRVELQDVDDVDYREFQRLAQSALQNIVKAGLSYEKLVERAEAAPYNPIAIDRLKTFDYETFMMENGLNESIFKKIRGYLSNGDITGAYKHHLASLKTIEGLLIKIKEGIDMYRMPPLDIFWQLNEQCAETSLFGSFVARVFHRLD